MPTKREQGQTIGREKIVQYLNEAHAMELAMVQTLTAHSAVTPRGDYRAALESHTRQTREHARKIERRLRELGEGQNLVQIGVGAAQAAIGQAVSAGKIPIDLARGATGTEKLLKNAKDESVSEQLEVATYLALQRIAEAVGDRQTADLCASIRIEERAMLTVLTSAIRRLAAAVVKEQVHGQKVFDVSTIGAADSVRKVARTLSRATSENSRPGRSGKARGSRRSGKAAPRQTNRPRTSSASAGQRRRP
jgi:ferritin-like metal-binding protein YciE